MAEMKMPVFTVRLSSGEQLTVTVTQAAQVAWDLERAKRQWPVMDQATSLWASFVVWNQARRDGQIDKNQPFESFSDQVMSLEYQEPVAVGD